MGLLDRFKRTKRRVADDRHADAEINAYLTDWLAARTGVEAWVEAPTGINKPSILLVAGDGEWTRRPIVSADWGYRFAERANIAAFEAGVVGYPQRMRDHDRRKKLRPQM